MQHPCRRPLFVRFFGHGIDAATGTPELARDPCQIDEFQHILIAVRLAHDAFGTKNNRSGRFSKDSRRSLNRATEPRFAASCSRERGPPRS